MKQWYALRSKPKKEASVASMLSRAEIEVYLPQMAVRSQRGGPVKHTPLFPGYLFGRLDPHLGEIRLARYTVGVLQVVGYEDQACPVPDEIIISIRTRVAASQGEVPACGFHSGDRVLITSGPLRDVEAIFDRHLSAAGRVQVLIQMLHRLCPADVHLAQLHHINVAGVASA